MWQHHAKQESAPKPVFNVYTSWKLKLYSHGRRYKNEGANYLDLLYVRGLTIYVEMRSCLAKAVVSVKQEQRVGVRLAG